jgi:type I restriction enzyme S subunit
MALGITPIEIINSGNYPLLAIHKTWKRIPLKEIAHVQNGFAFKSSLFTKSEGMPLIRIRDISNGKTQHFYSGDYDEDYVVRRGDILVGMDGDFNCSEWEGSDGLLNQRVCRIILNSEHYSKKFLLYVLQPYLNAINQETSSVTVKHLSSRTIEEIPLPFPPLPEQHRIVAKIEELFSELDNGIASLQQARAQLKTYRQSVLKWAFEGKLTTGNKNWLNVRLGNLANAIDPQPSHRTPPKVDEGIPYVSIKDFDAEQDKIDFTKARIVSSDVLKEHSERYKLQIGDFVIGKIGTIGKPVRIVLPQNYTLSANIVLIQPRKINATFLYYYFQSNLIEKELAAGKRATTQAAFGIQKVRELNIKLPSDNEQHQIVQEIESRLSVADKLEEAIEQSLQQAEALRQSILKQAFEGKLVPQETNEKQ